MSANPAFSAVPDYYDPVAVFATVFASTCVASDLADALTCSEVNVLVGLLACRDAGAADLWLAEHRHHCPLPDCH